MFTQLTTVSADERKTSQPNVHSFYDYRTPSESRARYSFKILTRQSCYSTLGRACARNPRYIVFRVGKIRCCYPGDCRSIKRTTGCWWKYNTGVGFVFSVLYSDIYMPLGDRCLESKDVLSGFHLR